ncbi:hypothetical protein [Arthrobacter sp. C152]
MLSLTAVEAAAVTFAVTARTISEGLAVTITVGPAICTAAGTTREVVAVPAWP